MDFKMNKRNVIGILSTIVLVILLTRSKFFNLLTETVLGRTLMLAFVLLISYVNPFLGLFAVLIIIISFNHHDMNVVQSYSNVTYEGFTEGAQNNKNRMANVRANVRANVKNAAEKATAVAAAAPKTGPNAAANAAKKAINQAAKKASHVKIAAKKAQNPKVLEINTEIKQIENDMRSDKRLMNALNQAANTAAKRKHLLEKKRANVGKAVPKTKKGASSNTKQGFTTGTEGFCMSDKESVILKGKPSNSIRMFNDLRNQTDDVSPYDNNSIFANRSSPI